MNALIVALMTWISVATGLPVPDALPEIAFATQEQINITLDVEDSGNATAKIIAFYTKATKVITLNASWDPTSIKDVSSLVHELTHYMANVDGRKFFCQGDSEAFAFGTQKKYLEEHGKDLFTLFEMDEMFYMLLTGCGDLR